MKGAKIESKAHTIESLRRKVKTCVDQVYYTAPLFHAATHTSRNFQTSNQQAAPPNPYIHYQRPHHISLPKDPIKPQTSIPREIEIRNPTKNLHNPSFKLKLVFQDLPYCFD